MGGLRSQQVGHIFLKEQSHQVVENTRQVSGIGQNKPDERILSRDGFTFTSDWQDDPHQPGHAGCGAGFQWGGKIACRKKTTTSVRP